MFERLTKLISKLRHGDTSDLTQVWDGKTHYDLVLKFGDERDPVKRSYHSESERQAGAERLAREHAGDNQVEEIVYEDRKTFWRNPRPRKKGVLAYPQRVPSLPGSGEAVLRIQLSSHSLLEVPAYQGKDARRIADVMVSHHGLAVVCASIVHRRRAFERGGLRPVAA